MLRLLILLSQATNCRHGVQSQLYLSILLQYQYKKNLTASEALVDGCRKWSLMGSLFADVLYWVHRASLDGTGFLIEVDLCYRISSF